MSQQERTSYSLACPRCKTRKGVVERRDWRDAGATCSRSNAPISVRKARHSRLIPSSAGVVGNTKGRGRGGKTARASASPQMRCCAPARVVCVCVCGWGQTAARTGIAPAVPRGSRDRLFGCGDQCATHHAKKKSEAIGGKFAAEEGCWRCAVAEGGGPSAGEQMAAGAFSGDVGLEGDRRRAHIVVSCRRKYRIGSATARQDNAVISSDARARPGSRPVAKRAGKWLRRGDDERSGKQKREQTPEAARPPPWEEPTLVLSAGCQRARPEETKNK